MADKVASIDVGANSIRLLVADIVDGGIRRLHLEREIVRLGKGLSDGDLLLQDRMELALSVIQRYALICREMGVKEVVAVGTSPLRKAKNSGDFVKRVMEDTGILIRTVSGEEEGYICLLGILRGTGKFLPLRAMVIDVGGGSTEFILWQGENKGYSISSLPLGMLNLTESYISSQPPSDLEISRCEDAILSVVNSALKGKMQIHPGTMMIGTAGTLTTLASIDLGLKEYDPERIHGHRLSREALERIFIRVKRSSRDEISRIPGMEHGREDVILSGIIIVKVLMDHLNAHEILISDWGLLEGIIVEKAHSELY